MADNIDIEFIKELAERTPFNYQISHEPYEMKNFFGEPPKIPINGYTEVKMYFTIAGSGTTQEYDPIVEIGVMYFQFNKFMNENFAHIIERYRALKLEEGNG